MKRTIWLIALCALVLAGCGAAPEAENAEDAVRDPVSAAQYEQEPFTLSSEDGDTIRQLLSGDGWISDATKCESDYTLVVDGQTIRYHSECGTFNDYSGQSARSLQLSEENRDTVNAILAQ